MKKYVNNNQKKKYCLEFSTKLTYTNMISEITVFKRLVQYLADGTTAIGTIINKRGRTLHKRTCEIDLHLVNTRRNFSQSFQTSSAHTP